MYANVRLLAVQILSNGGAQCASAQECCSQCQLSEPPVLRTALAPPTTFQVLRQFGRKAWLNHFDWAVLLRKNGFLCKMDKSWTQKN